MLVVLHVLQSSVQLVNVSQEFELCLAFAELLRSAILEGAVDTGAQSKHQVK